LKEEDGAVIKIFPQQFKTVIKEVLLIMEVQKNIQILILLMMASYQLIHQIAMVILLKYSLNIVMGQAIKELDHLQLNTKILNFISGEVI
jgi:hypothetical protein